MKQDKFSKLKLVFAWHGMMLFLVFSGCDQNHVAKENTPLILLEDIQNIKVYRLYFDSDYLLKNKISIQLASNEYPVKWDTNIPIENIMQIQSYRHVKDKHDFWGSIEFKDASPDYMFISGLPILEIGDYAEVMISIFYVTDNM